jgi:hypothetical protein
MANNQIDVTIRATNETNQGIDAAKRQIETFKESQRQALGQHRQDIERARGAAELLGAQFGIAIPRELRKVVAESALLGKALSSAFTVAAAVGFLEVIDRAIDKFIELTTSVNGFSEAQQEALRKAAKDATGFIRLQKEMQETYRASQLAQAPDDASRLALRQRFAAEDRSASVEAAERARREMVQAQLDAANFSRTDYVTNRLSNISNDKLPVGILQYRFGKEVWDAITTAGEKHAKAIQDAAAAAQNYASKMADVEQTNQGVIKVQEEANKLFDELKNKADSSYKQSLEAAFDRAAQAGKFLLGNLDEQIKAISALKNEADKLSPAEQRLRYFETLFKLYPEDKGLIREGLDFWREKVEGEASHLEKVLGSSGAISGKSWVDGFVKGISEIKDQNLPELVPTLLNPGEQAGYDKDPRAFSMLANAVPQFDQMSARMKTIQSISREVGDSFSNIFAELVDGTHSVSQAFANMAKSIAASIMQVVAKMFIMAAVERIVGAALGAFGGGAFHSGGTATVLSQDAFGMTLAGARAGGGPVSANMPYLVGERGPERFIPSTSGTIIPNGGGTPNFQMVVHNETGSQIDQSNTTPRFDGEKFVVDVFLKQMATNGPIRQMVRGGR